MINYMRFSLKFASFAIPSTEPSIASVFAAQFLKMI
jgi:hypothetical protein